VKKKDKIKWLILAWTIAFFGGIIFWLLRITRRIQIQGYKKPKLNPKPKGLILIHNHPSLWEPILLPFLFFPRFLFDFSFIPFITPDKKYFFEKWWFSPFRQVCLPVPRGNLGGEMRILRKMKSVLDKGNILIIAPEGGRTFKGTKFKIIKNGEIDFSNSLKENNKAKGIRRFKRGIGWLVARSQAEILLVWTEGGDKIIPNFSRPRFAFPRFWKKTIIKISKVSNLRRKRISEKEIVDILENMMLELGDRR